jgi:hypothetical protein
MISKFKIWISATMHMTQQQNTFFTVLCVAMAIFIIFLPSDKINGFGNFEKVSERMIRILLCKLKKI